MEHRLEHLFANPNSREADRQGRDRAFDWENSKKIRDNHIGPQGEGHA